jgi:hypothetical protein
VDSISKPVFVPDDMVGGNVLPLTKRVSYDDVGIGDFLALPALFVTCGNMGRRVVEVVETGMGPRREQGCAQAQVGGLVGRWAEIL